jgi:hypothetical protein
MFAGMAASHQVAAPANFGGATSNGNAAEFAKLIRIPSSRICGRLDSLVPRLRLIIHRDRVRGTAGRAVHCSYWKERRAMKEVAAIDRAIDQLLVQLGEMVLKLSSPQVTKRDDERRALVRSVNQYSRCAARSTDPRVHELNAELNETIRPRLRLVASR